MERFYPYKAKVDATITAQNLKLQLCYALAKVGMGDLTLF